MLHEVCKKCQSAKYKNVTMLGGGMETCNNINLLCHSQPFRSRISRNENLDKVNDWQYK